MIKVKYKWEIGIFLSLLGIAITVIAWFYPFPPQSERQEQELLNDNFILFFETMKNAEREQSRIDLLNMSVGKIGKISFSQLVDVVALFELENNKLHAFKILYQPDIKVGEAKLDDLIKSFNLNSSKRFVRKRLFNRSNNE